MLFKNKKVLDSIDQTIGNTPMVRLQNLKKKFKFNGEIIAKLEFFNPLGSVKDRIGLAMINQAEREKKINPETLRNDFEILSVLRNLKIIGIFTRLAVRDNKKKYLKMIPYAWQMINYRMKNNLEFKNLKSLLKSSFPKFIK